MKKVNLIRLLSSILVVFFLASIVCSSLSVLNLSTDLPHFILSKKDNVPSKLDSQLLYEEKENDFDADLDTHDFYFISLVGIPASLIEAQSGPSYRLITSAFFISAADVPLYLAKRSLLL